MSKKIYLDYKSIELSVLNAWETADKLAKDIKKTDGEKSIDMDYESLKVKIFMEILNEWKPFTLSDIDDQDKLKNLPS